MPKWVRFLINALPAAAWAVFVVLISVSPREAASHLADWAKFVGIFRWPAWLTDFRAGIAVTALVLLFYAWRFLWKRPRGALTRSGQVAPPAAALRADVSGPAGAGVGDERVAPRDRPMVGVLAGYKEGLERVLPEVEGAASDAQIEGLRRQYYALAKPALQYLLHECQVLGTARGFRFAGAHPEGALTRPTGWSEKKFELWTRVNASVLHLRDFLAELDETASGTPPPSLPKGQAPPPLAPGRTRGVHFADGTKAENIDLRVVNFDEGVTTGRDVTIGGKLDIDNSVRARTLGRNDPCWCGSGKKYKKCHGEDA